MRAQYLVYMALLVVVALILSLLERSISIPFIIPGAKIGLANLVTIIGLYTLTTHSDVIKIILVRVVLGAIFAGNVSNLMYSVAGALSSCVAMRACQVIFKDKLSILGVSVVGAIVHNWAQVFVAIFVLNNIWIFLYLPVLSSVAIVTGMFVGCIAKYCLFYLTYTTLYQRKDKLKNFM
ncbi:MAG: hypothetical protein BEN18_09790 [Epulopiscium sp. Nuni2H_MBin001]|nr:MAG: hypothetical protein BEN18_09790 [Epulopiscium sp. Nuni2H_MBin001]